MSYTLLWTAWIRKLIFPQLWENIFPVKFLFANLCVIVCNTLTRAQTISLFCCQYVCLLLCGSIILFYLLFPFSVLQLIKMIFAFDIDASTPTFSIIIFVLLIYHFFCLLYVLCPPHHVTLGLNYHFMIHKNHNISLLKIEFWIRWTIPFLLALS